MRLKLLGLSMNIFLWIFLLFISFSPFIILYYYNFFEPNNFITSVMAITIISWILILIIVGEKDTRELEGDEEGIFSIGNFIVLYFNNDDFNGYDDFQSIVGDFSKNNSEKIGNLIIISGISGILLSIVMYFFEFQRSFFFIPMWASCLISGVIVIIIGIGIKRIKWEKLFQ